jgi:hypothetical protein
MAVRIESHAEPIPGYRLIERIGGGGFGEVWKAEAPGGLMKAIKFVFGDLETAGDEEGVRAEQELKAMSRVKTVRHPYILSLERYDIIDGQLLIVMELADRNLWDRFRECRTQGLPGIPREELLGYLEETSEALDLMNHEYQLQHLDIKPQNLFLVGNHIKVADFGLVKDLEGMVASVTGGVTPVYAAPETFDGWVSRYCDQYSLAIVYQELLTAHRPFAGTNVRQLILQHIQGTPDLSALPPADRPAIARALSKKPEDRHPSCRDLVKALRENDQRDVARASAPADAGEAAPTAADQPAVGPVTPPPSPPDSSGPVTRWIRAHEENPLTRVATEGTPGGDQPETATICTSQRPRGFLPETEGDGVLFPALVIGLGGLGRAVLQQVTAHLTERFGSLDAVPHLRLICLDTDTEAMRLATTGPEGACLRRSDVIVAPLHRPSHYLKPREGRPRVDAWINPKMLYRIPRQAYSAGMRALGRLALVDNYRAISQRLLGELQKCTRPEILAEAQQQTGLTLRRTRPRVYVVTSLAGGTGSGMFVDLAYIVRSLLRQLGHGQPEVVGLLAPPPVCSHAPSRPALGNAYAALTELNHFSQPGTTFSANYDTGDGPRIAPITDTGPPFARCIFLPPPAGEAGADPASTAAVALSSHFLVAELTSPLGRRADEARRERQDGLAAAADLPLSSRWAEADGGMTCQTFGLHRLVWPKRAMLQGASRQLCQRLVERWMAKDGKPLREQVKQWLDEQWVKQELGPDGFIGDLHGAAENGLKKPPDTLFAEMIESFVRSGTHPAAPERTLAAVNELGEQLEKLLGRPVGPANPPRADRSSSAAVLETILAPAADSLAAQQGQKMAELAVCLIEQPAFRLAGAEEALRQMATRVEKALEHHEQLWKELAERAAAASAAIHSLARQIAATPPGKGGSARRSGQAPGAEQLTDLLRAYVKSRYQCLILQQVITILVCLRGQLSDQLRDIAFCRNRLDELARTFQPKEPGSFGSQAPAERGRLIFPAGCTTLAAAVSHLLIGVTDADFQGLDDRVQALIGKNFTALVQVCLGSRNVLKSLEKAMQQEVENALAERLTSMTILTMFPDRAAAPNGGDRALADALAEAFDEAGPDLPGLVTDAPLQPAGQLAVLLGPTAVPGPDLNAAANQAVPDEPMIVADHSVGPAANEILIYREATSLCLADLKLLGPQGREAYRQMNQVEHFTPHARIDITDWHPPVAEPAAGRWE